MKTKGLQITTDAEMAERTSFRAGGRAAVMAEARDRQELALLLGEIKAAGLDAMLLGNGSNTLFKDSGYDGVVLRLGEGFAKIQLEEQMMGRCRILRAGAAALLSATAKAALAAGLSGMEPLSGIPGSVGGGVFMNAGAYGGEMKDIVVDVEAMSPDGSQIRTFTGEEAKLSYRHSLFAENGWIILSARLRLVPGDKGAIAAQMKEFAYRRNSKQPVNYPSAGSTFKRPEGYFAGKLIEDAGLKGVSVGGAQVSTLHSGFIINTGGARATDILDLITLVQNTVYDQFGVKLIPEVRIIG